MRSERGGAGRTSAKRARGAGRTSAKRARGAGRTSAKRARGAGRTSAKRARGAGRTSQIGGAGLARAALNGGHGCHCDACSAFDCLSCTEGPKHLKSYACVQILRGLINLYPEEQAAVPKHSCNFVYSPLGAVSNTK